MLRLLLFHILLKGQQNDPHLVSNVYFLPIRKIICLISCVQKVLIRKLLHTQEVGAA